MLLGSFYLIRVTQAPNLFSPQAAGLRSGIQSPGMLDHSTHACTSGKKEKKNGKRKRTSTNIVTERKATAKTTCGDHFQIILGLR